ncbi:MAG: DUF5596 domain-containing protein [Planctomycetota bacterium]|nr:DUF5596 domain-containing protein [Planctomycetota bacterium]
MSEHDTTMADPVLAFASLGLPAPTDSFKKEWAETQRSYRSAFGAEQLADISAAVRLGLFKSEAGAAITGVLPELRKNPALMRLAWHCHAQMSSSPWGGACEVSHWPNLPEALGEPGRLFYAAVLLTCVPAIRKFHAERGIPDDVSLDTLSDLELWTNEYKRLNGKWGCEHRGWLSNHFGGKLFKLGRLQFETHPFSGRFYVFRNKRDRRVAMFASPGLRFRSDGYFDGANGRHDPNAWESTFTCDTKTIRGNPVDPVRGVLKKELLELPAAEWTCVLAQFDPTLGVHIAATGPMTFEECGASFRRAAEFFPKHFPERPFKAFVCSSWLLDAQFEDYLKPDANIVQWLREWFLYPHRGASDFQHIQRVFDEKFDRENLAANPQKSSVQRAIVEHMKRGKDWLMGASIYMVDDLDWGKQVYRKMGAPRA